MHAPGAERLPRIFDANARGNKVRRAAGVEPKKTPFLVVAFDAAEKKLATAKESRACWHRVEFHKKTKLGRAFFRAPKGEHIRPIFLLPGRTSVQCEQRNAVLLLRVTRLSEGAERTLSRRK